MGAIVIRTRYDEGTESAEVAMSAMYVRVITKLPNSEQSTYEVICRVARMVE